MIQLLVPWMPQYTGKQHIVTKLQFFLQVTPPKCSKPYLFSDYSFWGRLSTVSRKPEWSQCRRGFSLAKRGKRGWCSQGNAVGAEVDGVGENGGVQSRRVLHQAEHGAVWVNRTPLFRSSSLFIVHVPRQSRFVEFLEQPFRQRGIDRPNGSIQGWQNLCHLY